MRCQMSGPSLETRRNMWTHSIDAIHFFCSPRISSVPKAPLKHHMQRWRAVPISFTATVGLNEDTELILSLTMLFPALFLHSSSTSIYHSPHELEIPCKGRHWPNSDHPHHQPTFTHLKQRKSTHSLLPHLSCLHFSFSEREAKILCIKQHLYWWVIVFWVAYFTAYLTIDIFESFS